MNTGTRADIDYVVGRADRVFIVFYHDHRVTQVTQVDQGFQQAFVIALVQANGWLIQYVHHAYQASTDLACQANTLSFTTGQRFRRT
ncbi:hypothetical protein D3C80_1632040 [compost metagenome]